MAGRLFFFARAVYLIVFQECATICGWFFSLEGISGVVRRNAFEQQVWGRGALLNTGMSTFQAKK